MNSSLFRSCTASLSARALTRPAARAGAAMPCRAALARRYYSEKAPESPAADAAKEETGDEVIDPSQDVEVEIQDADGQIARMKISGTTGQPIQQGAPP